jgi:hypothetical protein
MILAQILFGQPLLPTALPCTGWRNQASGD